MGFVIMLMIKFEMVRFIMKKVNGDLRCLYGFFNIVRQIKKFLGMVIMVRIKDRDVVMNERVVGVGIFLYEFVMIVIF